SRRLGVHRDALAVGEQLAVIAQDRALARLELGDALELAEADRGLHVRQLVLVADDVGPELALLAARAAMVRERQHALVEVVVVGDEHAALAGRQRLRAVERERAERAHAASALAVPDRADRLGSVLD